MTSLLVDPDQLADRVRDLMLKAVDGPGSQVVAELARRCVLRAAGCICSGSPGGGAVYAEDVLCPVHGTPAPGGSR